MPKSFYVLILAIGIVGGTQIGLKEKMEMYLTRNWLTVFLYISRKYKPVMSR